MIKISGTTQNQKDAVASLRTYIPQTTASAGVLRAGSIILLQNNQYGN